MAQKPNNPRLWQMLVGQAQRRFKVYPSQAAAHWVHEQYTSHGGGFFDTASMTPEQKARYDAQEHP